MVRISLYLAQGFRIRMPRILLLCEYATVNGGEQSMLTMLPLVQGAGWQVEVACPQAGPLADQLGRHDVPVVDWDVQQKLAGRSLADRRAALEKLLRRTAPDLLHANSLAMSRLSGPVVARLAICSIGHLRDIVRLSKQAMADVNCHGRLLAVSAATRDWHVQQGLDPAKVHVAHNGVDLDFFHPQPANGYLHRELQIPPERKLIATIGQLVLRKGVDVCLAAVSEVFSRQGDVELLIIGERYSNKDEAIRHERELRQAADRPPLRGRVHFLGYRQDIPRLLNELHLLLHTAREEPLGRVLLEAAASGVAIVATDAGGTREIFPDSVGAIVIPAGNPAACAGAVCELLRDEDRRRRLGRAARKRAAAKFSAPRAAEVLLQHYDAELQRRL